MREILFRGKSVNSGDWVEGSLVITTIDPADDTPIKHYHIEDMTIGVFPNEFQSGLSETVDPKTVGQFTGLTDKNGKKIFEGDIVTASVTENLWDKLKKYTQTYEISYHPKYCYFYLKRDRNNLLFDGNWSYALSIDEVIGNIHDNPELLKED